MQKLSITPKQVTKRLLAAVSPRARDVLTHRFGLGATPERKTLEHIGKKYNITRERVRQIENFALNSIAKSDTYTAEQEAFEELRQFLAAYGSVLAEEDMLSLVANDESSCNHVYFLLTLGEPFEKRKEDMHFCHHWSVDADLRDSIADALSSIASELKPNDLIAESDMIAAFRKRLGSVPREYDREDVLRRWLRLSKKLGANQLGEWGLASSPNIRIRGIRDYAYLVIRHHGSPLHFSEVAKLITEMFGCRSHPATCHNELIKDKQRFVLVGRGLYGLAEWGYTDGVVRDVIADILRSHGPLSKEELVSRVLKERHVKENTVMVNLQNKKYFVRMDDGRYALL